MTETKDRRVAAQPTLSIVGAGRAGSALAVALHDAGHPIAAVCSRTLPHAEQLADAVDAAVVATPAAAVRAADITLLTVPDTAIADVSAAIAASGVALRGRSVVHCSARLGPEVAAAAHSTAAAVGVLHPLQAMSGAASSAALRGAFFRIEAPPLLRAALAQLVRSLDGHVLSIAPEDRALYHAAAVLAGNAPHALLARATELLESCGVERATAHAALATLLEGAAANARRQLPEQALTGPVVRGDAGAINAHLDALQSHPQALELYEHVLREMEALLARNRPAELQPRLHRVA